MCADRRDGVVEGGIASTATIVLWASRRDGVWAGTTGATTFNGLNISSTKLFLVALCADRRDGVVEGGIASTATIVLWASRRDGVWEGATGAWKLSVALFTGGVVNISGTPTRSSTTELHSLGPAVARARLASHLLLRSALVLGCCSVSTGGVANISDSPARSSTGTFRFRAPLAATDRLPNQLRLFFPLVSST